jgi:hypothetical protein
LHYTDTRHWKEDYRGVAELVRAVTLPGDVVYYTPYPGLLKVLLEDRKVALLEPDVPDVAANPSGCGVFIINSPWLSDASGTLQRKLEQIPGVRTHQLRGFTVYVAPVRKTVLPKDTARAAWALHGTMRCQSAWGLMKGRKGTPAWYDALIADRTIRSLFGQKVSAAARAPEAELEVICLPKGCMDDHAANRIRRGGSGIPD